MKVLGNQSAWQREHVAETHNQAWPLVGAVWDQNFICALDAAELAGTSCCTRAACTNLAISRFLDYSMLRQALLSECDLKKGSGDKGHNLAARELWEVHETSRKNERLLG